MRIMQDEQTLNVPLDEQAAAVLPFDADAGDEPLEDETEGAGADYVSSRTIPFRRGANIACGRPTNGNTNRSSP
jgi:hypothetical protein